MPATAQSPRSGPSGPVQHVIVVTIDGLMPSAYLDPDAHQLRVPTLRRIRDEGASSGGALSVFPSLTYPAHTSLATGVRPILHGVVSNGAFDPWGMNQDGWRWYSSDVPVPRLWDVAREAGYRTALIDWPVTVGADADLHVPEFWRARVAEDLKLIASLSTPKDILERVAAESKTFAQGFRPQDVSDEAGFDIAIHALRHYSPHLTFLHVWQVDAAQHAHGLWSTQATQAIENADRQLARLIEATEQLGLRERTAFIVASDHGFRSVERCYNPRALLVRAGLLSVNGEGKVVDWDATVHTNHGSAFVYLRRPDDEALARRTLEIFEEAARAEPNAIAKLLDARAIREKGGDPNAFLALDAAPGAYFAMGLDSWQTPPKYRGNHGYDPEHVDMLASLLFFGAGVTRGKLLDARLIDVAPTAAHWLGLDLPGAEGRVLFVTP